MNITSIIKKEYYDDVFIIDLNEITYINIEKDKSMISFKNQDAIIIQRHPKDANNDLKKIILDLYSSWKKCVENMVMIMNTIHSMEG